MTSKWGIIITSMTVMFLSAMSSSLQEPFYPAVANNVGWSLSVSNMIFGFFGIVSMVAPVHIGNNISLIGPKRVLLLGMTLLGGSLVIFSSLGIIREKYSFLTYSFIIKFLESVGATAADLAVMTIFTVQFPDQASTFLAWADSIYSLGSIVGPGVGGILYDIGGFHLPFLVTGMIILLCIIPCSIMTHEDIEADSDAPSETIDMWSVLRLPVAWIAVILCSAGGGISSYGFIAVTMEPHLRQFDVSGKMLGGIFLLDGLAYVAFSPLWGTLCDKEVLPIELMLLGSALQVVALVLIGPIPWLPLDPALWRSALSVFLSAVSMSMQAIPSLAFLREACMEAGLPSNTHVHGLISGVWMGSFSMGGFIGPIIGGILFDHLGFRMESAVYSFINVFLFIFLLTYVIHKKRDKAGKRHLESIPLIKARRKSLRV